MTPATLWAASVAAGETPKSMLVVSEPYGSTAGIEVRNLSGEPVVTCLAGGYRDAPRFLRDAILEWETCHDERWRRAARASRELLAALEAARRAA